MLHVGFGEVLAVEELGYPLVWGGLTHDEQPRECSWARKMEPAIGVSPGFDDLGDEDDGWREGVGKLALCV